MYSTLQSLLTQKEALGHRLPWLRQLAFWLGCISLFSVAFALRYTGCFTFPFFGDEAFTLDWSRDYQAFWKTWNIDTISYLKYPLLFAMNSLLLDHFHDPVTAIRVIPLAAGILLFPIFMWLLNKRFGAVVMFVALTIVAFNPTHIFFSQFARYYSLVFLLANLALYTFFISFERRSWRLFLVSQFISILAFLSHPSAGTLVAVEVGYLLILGMFSWMEGRSLMPRRDAFTMTVAAVFSVACLALIAGSIVILLKWAVLSKYQANYDVSVFTSGVILRIGIPLVVWDGVASLYYFFRRDQAGVFLSLAVFCPIVAGAMLSSIGMDVNPIYVAYIIFPASLVAAYFLAELLNITGWYGSDSRSRYYSAGLLFAIAAMLTLGDVPELVSYYIDGNRPDFPAAMKWIDKQRAGKGAIVITTSIDYPIDFCKRKGISYEHLSREALVDDVIEAVGTGKVVVMSYAWWAAMPPENIGRIANISHWLILRAERDGLTPIMPSEVLTFDKDNAKRVVLATKEALPAFAKNYQLETRIGRTRYDHRQNYLLVYGPRHLWAP